MPIYIGNSETITIGPLYDANGTEISDETLTATITRPGSGEVVLSAEATATETAGMYTVPKPYNLTLTTGEIVKLGVTSPAAEPRIDLRWFERVRERRP